MVILCITVTLTKKVPHSLYQENIRFRPSYSVHVQRLSIDVLFDPEVTVFVYGNFART